MDKPADLDSQNSRKDRASVVGWLEERFGFAGLVHRLDFGTSGLMVCAKTPAAAKRLTEAMQLGEISRNYLAVAFGKILPNEGTFDEPLEGENGVQEARTHYRVLERFANATLVEVELDTGRKHQIRRHFSNANHPLLGDHLYKKKGSDRLFTRPALHAQKLKVMGTSYEVDPPPDFANLVSRLRATRS